MCEHVNVDFLQTVCCCCAYSQSPELANSFFSFVIFAFVVFTSLVVLKVRIHKVCVFAFWNCVHTFFAFVKMFRLILSVMTRVLWWLIPEVHGGCGSFVSLHMYCFMKFCYLSGRTD